MKWTIAWMLLAGVLLAGCTGPGAAGQQIYTHKWAYGPGYGGNDRLPVFQDMFSSEDDGNLTVAVEWAIQTGRAAIVLTPPGGEAVNLTDEATGGPGGDSGTKIGGAAGQWGFRIPTWRGEDGAFPQGRVEVRIIAA